MAMVLQTNTIRWTMRIQRLENGAPIHAVKMDGRCATIAMAKAPTDSNFEVMPFARRGDDLLLMFES